MRWESAPGLAAMLGSSDATPPSPEQQEVQAKAQMEYLKAASVIEQESRTAMTRFSAIFCTCPRRFDPQSSPYADCQIHGQFMITPDGRVL